MAPFAMQRGGLPVVGYLGWCLVLICLIGWLPAFYVVTTAVRVAGTPVREHRWMRTKQVCVMSPQFLLAVRGHK